MTRAIVVVVVIIALAGAAAGAQAAIRPSKAACAIAWNHTATQSLRTSIVRAHPRGAFISGDVNVGTDTWTRGSNGTSTSSVGCGIQFILPSGRTLTVYGPWKSGVVATWTGPVRSNRPIPVPDNTFVHPDGSISFHG